MYTIEEIICEIRREVSMLQVAIAKGDLDQAEAARRRIMKDILEHHYLALEENDREQADLFLKAVPMRCGRYHRSAGPLRVR